VLLLVIVLFLGLAKSSGAATSAAYELEGPVRADAEIDKAVFSRLKNAGMQPANLCSDSVFVRRAYLDVIGTLPTAKEVQAFLQDKSADKRRLLLERLLAREEFADYWAMKWSDLLRVKAEFPINLWPNAAQAYHRWLRTAIRDDMPYDRFVRELLTSSGSNFRVPQVNFYRAMQNKEPAGLAQAVALNFMGVRADKWPREQLAGMAAFFTAVGYKSTSEWKEEIIFFDQDSTNFCAKTGRFPDGTQALLSTARDPREVFADWLITPKNPWFTRNIANRAWSWFLGRGIIHEPDDIRPDNPPSNPALLALLEKELIASRYDLKALFRLILTSKTYQLSSIRRDQHPEAEANFAFYPARRLDAEVLIDSLCGITASSEKYSSAIPEPFTFIPEKQRSIALPDGSISSPFLELFGRPPRDTGLESERNNRPTPAQSLHLLNSSHIQRKLEQSPFLQNLADSDGSPRDAINGLYLMLLSRFPTEEEWNTIAAYPESKNVKSREALTDVAWALVNSAEFLYRH
jgi:hypothetical protein